MTKTNMSDDPSNHWNERTKKLKFLLSLDICVFSLTCGDMCPHTRLSLNGHGILCDVTKFVFDPDFTSFPPMFKMEKRRVFKTYEEFEAALKLFSVATHSLFVKRSSESVKELILKHLKYESILFVCKHSPSKRTSSSTDQRPCQR